MIPAAKVFRLDTSQIIQRYTNQNAKLSSDQFHGFTSLTVQMEQ